MEQQTEFIPYEQALELKELGYDLKSVSGYSYPDSDKLLTQAILYQQAFRWFREKYGYAGIPNPFGYEILDRDDINYEWAALYEEVSNNYEEAELACLKKLIEIVKNK